MKHLPHQITLIRTREPQSGSRMPAGFVARVEALDEQGYPVIEVEGQPSRAESLVPVNETHIQHRCLVSWAELDGVRPPVPVIQGFLWEPGTRPEPNEHIIEADERLVLTCGRSSLELNADGTVHLQGVTVTTLAYGSNRIKGSAVKIN